MKKSRYSEAQIVSVLKEAESGVPVSELCRTHGMSELLSNLVFEGFGSCGDLVWVCDFNSVFERDASDDFGEVVKAA
jgi:hypothetical protein